MQFSNARSDAFTADDERRLKDIRAAQARSRDRLQPFQEQHALDKFLGAAQPQMAGAGLQGLLNGGNGLQGLPATGGDLQSILQAAQTQQLVQKLAQVWNFLHPYVPTLTPPPQAASANQTLLGQQQQLGLLNNPAAATFAQHLGLLQGQAALNGVGRGGGRGGKRQPPNKKGSICNACRGLDHWAGDPGKRHQ